MDKSDLIDLLNEDLELEYRSIVQYVQYVASGERTQRHRRRRHRSSVCPGLSGGKVDGLA
jgi:hypothetical protein